MMENKLEQLLNSLIEKGWKPFGDNAIKFDYDGKKTRYGYGAITYKYRDSYIDDYGDEVEYEEWRHQFNNRELVSKESDLWQFVCENKMVRLETDSGENDSYLCYYNDDGYPKDYFFEMERDDYRFRLIESALKDESELESFILDNIKVEGQQHK